MNPNSNLVILWHLFFGKSPLYKSHWDPFCGHYAKILPKNKKNKKKNTRWDMIGKKREKKIEKNKQMNKPLFIEQPYL
jgi:hypothetical protein